MKSIYHINWVILVLILGLGCQKPAPSPSPTNNTNAEGPSQAQPKLPTVKLYVGTNELITEIARSSYQLQTGMMFRKSMEENEAMIFVFSQPSKASFYMRNTSVSLSAAYIDSEGVIREIHDLKPFDETPVDASTDQIRYVLEVRQGWFDRRQIKPGIAVGTERGSLAETFFGSSRR